MDPFDFKPNRYGVGNYTASTYSYCLTNYDAKVGTHYAIHGGGESSKNSETNKEEKNGKEFGTDLNVLTGVLVNNMQAF